MKRPSIAYAITGDANYKDLAYRFRHKMLFDPWPQAGTSWTTTTRGIVASREEDRGSICAIAEIIFERGR
jgi:hypothetical protein